MKRQLTVLVAVVELQVPEGKKEKIKARNRSRRNPKPDQNKIHTTFLRLIFLSRFVGVRVSLASLDYFCSPTDTNTHAETPGIKKLTRVSDSRIRTSSHRRSRFAPTRVNKKRAGPSAGNSSPTHANTHTNSHPRRTT